MQVAIISEKIQEFNGRRFYLAGRYYRRVINRKISLLLHRVVWEFHHGVIPPDHHIHHRNHDRNNNQIDNLEVMEKGKHLLHHGGTWTEEMRAKARKHAQQIRPLAKAWHASEVGIAWHRKHGNAVARKHRGEKRPKTEAHRMALLASRQRWLNSPEGKAHQQKMTRLAAESFARKRSSPNK